MRIEELSKQAQAGLREWAICEHGDEELFDTIGSSPESWGWIYFQLRVAEDRDAWFPHGKWATLQVIEGKLLAQANLDAREPGTLDYGLIPKHTLETLTEWVTHARPMGSFCKAVISNDLAGACARADSDNRRALFAIVAWLHNKAPIGSWGSPSALQAWPARLHARVEEEWEPEPGTLAHVFWKENP